MPEKHKRGGLYERLLEERAEEERRRGRPLGGFYGLDSKVLDRRLDNAPADRAGYKAVLYRLYEYIGKGVHSPGSGMHFNSLKRKYAKEYAPLRAESMGQGEIF